MQRLNSSAGTKINSQSSQRAADPPDLQTAKGMSEQAPLEVSPVEAVQLAGS